jgi:hypothetical protein
MKRGLPLAAAATLAALAGTACEPLPGPVASPPAAPCASAPPVAAPVTATPPAPRKLDPIPRLEWNRLAAELDLPLFWIADKNGSGVIDPDELAVLWRASSPDTPWTEGGAFTEAFYVAHAAMAAARAKGPQTEDIEASERRRRAAVSAELAQGMPTLVRSDFHEASAEDRAIVQHVLAAADLIERIYAKQRGADGMFAQILPDDAASRALFRRNQGPWCEAPKTERDPDCSALPQHPARIGGLYPAALQREPKFCEKLDARADQKALLTPFNVVVERGDDLAPVPYQVHFKAEMEGISRELAAAAAAITSPTEAALKAYLEADAKAFLDGDWAPADEAWARMGVNNSKWYLRVAPDETYADPCSRKAGFQVSFARINQASLAWQQKLDPHKTAMETALAKLAGPPYAARQVTFHLPDFIDVVVNAGDARNALGATVGESLPNWGKVVDEGRGRTVAMTNFYTDEDSRAVLRERASSLLCASSLDPTVYDPELGIMSTVLHEASHNLGPAHDYNVKGKTPSEVFGGPLAAMLEELKAQTSAAYFVDWLGQKGLVDKRRVGLSHVADILWGFGHISTGMYAGDGSSHPYAQLAAIEAGAYLASGAMEFRPKETAANGRDVGCFQIHDAKLPAAVAALDKAVLGTMGRGDKPAAIALRKKHTEDEGEWKRLRGVITERWLRHPRATFVYSIDR